LDHGGQGCLDAAEGKSEVEIEVVLREGSAGTTGPQFERAEREGDRRSAQEEGRRRRRRGSTQSAAHTQAAPGAGRIRTFDRER